MAHKATRIDAAGLARPWPVASSSFCALLRPGDPNGCRRFDNRCSGSGWRFLFCHDVHLARPPRNPAAVFGSIQRGFSAERRLKMDLLRILIAILLPPLGVFLQVGFAGAFWLNILLTLLGYIPGIVHAVWIIARR